MSIYNWIQRKLLGTYVEWWIKNPNSNHKEFHIDGINNTLKAMKDGYIYYTEIRPPYAIKGCTSMKAVVAKNKDYVNLYLEINGKKVTSAGSFIGELAAKKTGDVLNLKVYSNGTEKTLNVKNINVGRLLLCANFLLFLKSDAGNYKLRRANLCGNRFCPICSWVEAKRNAFKILELIMYVREIEKKELVFMTLTVPNCKGEDLTVTIDKLNKSFKRLMETKRFKNICLGYIRKLEITYNEEANTYHPHFHIIMAVNKSYFTSRDYLKILDLLELWRKATKDNSITQVDLKKVRMGSIKEVMEIATYTTKMKDLYKNEEVFIILYGALRGRQIITYNGIFKDLCKLQEEKKLDVSNIKQLTDIQEKATKEVSYKWKKEEKEYEEYYVRELAEDEIEKFYNLNIDKIIN